MFLDFIKQANLVIINTLPVSKGLFTRFMGDSSENGVLLDYGLIDDSHVPNVTSFIIDEKARYAAGSDHALLVATLSFSEKNRLSWCQKDAIRFDFSHDSSYSVFQENLNTNISSIPIRSFSTLPTSEMLPHLTSALTESGRQSFGVRVRKVKRGRKLPRPIIMAIKAKNRLATELSDAIVANPPHSPDDIAKLKQQLYSSKQDIKDMILDLRLKRVHHIRSKILRHDPTRRKFWRFLSSQIKAAGTISALYDSSGSMVFEREQIEAVVMEHFGKMFVGSEDPVFVATVPDD